LVELGHRDIVHVDGGAGPGSADRRASYRRAVRRHRLATPARGIAGDYTENRRIAAVPEVLAAALPTALLAAHDPGAPSLLDGFARAGVAVPQEISLMGFDDSKLSDHPRVDLTTVNQDAAELAEHSTRLAVEMLHAPSSIGEDVVLRPALVVRGTTAAPAY